MMDFLRRIGVLRSGTVTWKGDAAARPVAADTDDFSARNRDNAPGTAGPSAAGQKTGRQGKVLHYLALAFGLVVLAIMAANHYFGPWFWGNAAFWFAFTHFTKRSATHVPYSLGKMVALLVLACLGSFLSLAAIPGNKVEPGPGVPLDSLRRVELAMDLENDLGLEDVRLAVANGDVLEVRTKTPINVSPRAIASASAYIFAYLQPRIPQEIKKMRIILTVNDLDALFIETSCKEVTQWQAGELPEKAYLTGLKIVNLGVAPREANATSRQGKSAPAVDTWRAEGLQ